MARTFLLNRLPNQTEIWREKFERDWKRKLAAEEDSDQEEGLRAFDKPNEE